MSEGWALFTTYSGQVCQSGSVVAQEAVALGPCLSYLDQSTGIVLANYKQLHVASGAGQFSIVTYQYPATDQCTGAATPTVATDGPYSTSLGCYNQVFTYGPKDPNAISANPSSSTFRFIPGLNGGYNIPQFNSTGVLSVSFSAPCTLTSTPTSVRVFTDQCMTGSGSSTLYKCSPSWSKSTYQVSTFSGSSVCCMDGASCTEYGSSYAFVHCRTALKTTNSMYRYQNQTCTTPPWPTSPPVHLPTFGPTYTPLPSTSPTPRPPSLSRASALSAASTTGSRTAIIVVCTTVVPVVAYLLFLYIFRRRAVFGRVIGLGPAPAPASAPSSASASQRTRTRTSGRAVVATAAIANPIMEPHFEVEAVLVHPRGGGKPKERDHDSLSGVPVVEAHSVVHVDHIPPSAPPQSP